MSIYASTNCLKNPKNLISVLNKYKEAGIENVELGSVHEYFDVKELKKYNFNFLIHNYFPPPKIPFNFNLASSDSLILKKSISLAQSAIDLCTDINSPLYTFHAGFTVDPSKLGKPFEWKNIVDKSKSLQIFYDSLGIIIDYAKKSGIKIAMEPNVVEKFNLINGKNKLLLMSDYDEINDLYNIINKNDLGLLLDLGHTAVTSYWLNFNKDEFVKNCSDKVSAIHISNNDGMKDQHKSLTNDCWQVTKLKMFKKIPIILETMNLNVTQIKGNIEIVKEFSN